MKIDMHRVILLLFLIPLQALSQPLINPYDNRELECLALNIYHEARGEEEIDRDMVGRVTLNRVEDSKFPDTVCGVVWQRKQFSWTGDDLSNTPKEKKAYSDAIDMANLIMFEYMYDVADKIDGALYYHADHISPNWDYSKIVMLGKYGSHIVYKDRQ